MPFHSISAERRTLSACDRCRLKPSTTVGVSPSRPWTFDALSRYATDRVRRTTVAPLEGFATHWYRPPTSAAKCAVQLSPKRSNSIESFPDLLSHSCPVLQQTNKQTYAVLTPSVGHSGFAATKLVCSNRRHGLSIASAQYAP